MMLASVPGVCDVDFEGFVMESRFGQHLCVLAT